MTEKYPVPDDQYRAISTRLHELMGRVGNKRGSGLHPEALIYQIQDIIEGNKFVRTRVADVPIWQTINVGIHKLSRELLKDLKEKMPNLDLHCLFDDEGSETRIMPPLESKKREIDLVLLSGWQLGLTYNASRLAVYARSLQLGFKLCPPEVAFQLWLQKKSLSFTGGLHNCALIGMEPILEMPATDIDDSYFYSVGYVVEDVAEFGKPFIGDPYGGSDKEWDEDYFWIFEKPRIKQ